MFKIVLSDVDVLKNSVPIIAEIIDEGIFNVNQNGIFLLMPDRTMVAVVDFKIPASVFDEYNIDEPAILGLNMANLSAVLKRVKKTDKLILQTAKNRLVVQAVGNGIRTFEIPLLDVKAEKPPVDQLNFSCVVGLDSNIIEDGIVDAEVIGDAVVFEANPDVFKMYARGDVASAKLEMQKGSQGLLKLEAKGLIKSQYPLDYLKKMIKVGKLSPQTVLEFGSDYPMRMSFNVVDKLSLSFILAPRVSE